VWRSKSTAAPASFDPSSSTARSGGRGLGKRLTAQALDLAAAAGIRDVYLLTVTAAEFFRALGFEREERSRAPECLLDSEEFRSACPESAILMHVRVGS
jgi:N-acetylglutamate synthase-like GNAT family acetyltransferase